MTPEEMDAQPIGATAEDCEGDTWVKVEHGNWACTTPSAGVFIMTSEDVVETYGPVAPPDAGGPTVEKTVTVKAQEMGWGGYDGPESLTLHLMADGTVRWER